MRIIKRKRLEFPISKSLINLYYNEVVLWIGILFCPMIALVSLITNCIMFITKYIILKLTMKFPDKPITNGKPTFFFTVMLVTCYISIIPVVVFFSSSDSCGPYAG
jgi:transmembrane channel-like protein